MVLVAKRFPYSGNALGFYKQNNKDVLITADNTKRYIMWSLLMNSQKDETITKGFFFG